MAQPAPPHTLTHRFRNRFKQALPEGGASILPDEQIYLQLDRTIALILKAAGFDSGTPGALESLRALAQEYIEKLLSLVFLSMRSCRRTSPTAWDFEQALYRSDLSGGALLKELDLQIPRALTNPSFPPPPPKPESMDLRLPFLDNGANSSKQASVDPFKLPCCPAIPSQHTYKSSPSFPERETDPQRLQELAAEQGRLGEEATRSLIAAGNKKPNADSDKNAPWKRLDRIVDRNKLYDELWEMGQKELHQGQVQSQEGGNNDLDIDYGSGGEEGFMLRSYPAQLPPNSAAEIGATVNSDSIYERKPAKTAPAGATKASTTAASKNQDVVMGNAS